MPASLFAHQGGWDEILFVVVPILIFAGLLAVANRRAGRIEEQRRAEDDDGNGPTPEPGTSGTSRDRGAARGKHAGTEHAGGGRAPERSAHEPRHRPKN